MARKATVRRNSPTTRATRVTCSARLAAPAARSFLEERARPLSCPATAPAPQSAAPPGLSLRWHRRARRRARETVSSTAPRHRVHVIRPSNLADGLLPLEGFQHHPELQLRRGLARLSS